MLSVDLRKRRLARTRGLPARGHGGMHTIAAPKSRVFSPLVDVLCCWVVCGTHQALFDFERAVRDFQVLVEGDAADRQWSRRLHDARALRDLTHYQVLGVSQDCDVAALKKAYRQLCLRWHPDKHTSSAEDQQRANAAFRVRNADR